MIKDSFLAKIAGLGYFNRWHPEVALRYLPIIDLINKFDSKDRILEVGSGGLGIAPYLGREVVGVDIDFYPPFHPLLKQVKGSVLHLPFPPNSFKIVICVDMLEHLEPAKRQKAISQMLKIAEKMVIIAVPCGREAYLQDKYLNQLFKKKYKSPYRFLDEQVQYGLPEENDIKNASKKGAEDNHKEITIKIKGNENLKLRYFLMRGWVSNNLIVNIIFRKILLFAIPILRLFNQEPTYRKIFIVNINP